MMKNLWQRRGPSSLKPGGCFVQHTITPQERRKESSSSDSDSSDSESSYKTSSQISPRGQNYNVKFNKPRKYNPTNNDMALSANAEKDEDSIGLSEVDDTNKEDIRNICASINVPELVKYFDGLELYNGQILTGRATREKLWETTNKKPKTGDYPDSNNDTKYNNDNIVIHPSSDHTYSRPPKSEKSKTFVGSNPRRDEFFDNERFRNVCTSRRRKKNESTKSSVVVVDQCDTAHKETPGVSRHDNTEDSTRTKTNNPIRKYTSVVGPMTHNYQPVIDITPNDNFNVTTRRNNDSRLHLNQSISNIRNGTKFMCKPNPKSSNIKPQPIEVTGGTYVSQRDRGDPMGYYHRQKKDYTSSTSACLEDQNKYQTEKWSYCDESAGLYTQPCSHIGPKDRKNNLLCRPSTIPPNDVLLHDLDPEEDNNPEVKKDDYHNLTYDITSDECSNSLCLRRKHKEHRCQVNDTEEANSKITASKFSIRQSPTRPSVLSIRIDINLSHPNNVYATGSKSLDLQKDERKGKMGKNP